MTGKCRVCGKKIEGKFKKIIIFGFTPWRKPKFICQGCKKKKKTVILSESETDVGFLAKKANYTIQIKI